MGKLLELKARIKGRNHKENKKSAKSAEIHDITEQRLSAIKRERREVKRTILSEFIGAFVILPERGLLKVSLFDISEKGIAFDMEVDDGYFNNSDKVAMRIYLNHRTFFSFIVDVTNVRLFEKEGVVRHGANFMKGTINDVALHHFVKFIETVSANLETDQGDLQVSHES
jgi:hypothetical protein